MTRKRHLIAFPLTLFGLTCTQLLNTAGQAAVNDTGHKGAEIYCFMRNSGNEHEVSWNASYAVIKRQKTNTIFKTSPEHGAVMIIEAVVQNPSKYKNCGRHLGDLFGSSKTINEGITIPLKTKNVDRYSY